VELKLEWLPGRFAVCRLDSCVAIPDWALLPGALMSITRTAGELSIIVDDERAPSGVVAERGFAAVRVVGPLSFSMVGVLAKLSGALATAGVPVLAISTYETDVLLVRAEDMMKAWHALRAVAEVAKPA